MGSTNKTTNYELSQYIGTDKPSWLNDYNNDMLKIDTQMKANATAAGNAQTTATSADGKADINTQAISTLNTQINTPSTGLAAVVSGHTTDISGINSTIGSVAMPTTAQTLTGAIAELATTKITINDVSNATVFNGSKTFSIVADGVKSYRDLLSDLYTAFITYLAAKDAKYRCIVSSIWMQGVTYSANPFNNEMISNSFSSGLTFTISDIVSSSFVYYKINVSTSSSIVEWDGSTVTDLTSQIPAANQQIELYIQEYTLL